MDLLSLSISDNWKGSNSEPAKPFKLILGHKAFIMKDIKDAKAAADQQRHNLVILWMREKNFKYIDDDTYIYKTFTIIAQHETVA